MPWLSKRPGLYLVTAGTAALGAVVAVLPIVGGREVPTLTMQMLAYALVFLPVGAFLYGLLVSSGDIAVRRLLLLAVAAAASGVGAAYLAGPPEALLEGPALVPFVLLFFANVFRITAAACLGLALARRVDSSRIALLIAGLATAADLFSVFAGPTQALVESEAPALDYLLLWFPTFGYPLGFALGVSDFVFLALFAGIARHLDGLHALPTLALGCLAVLAAMLTALLLGGHPLPALPFIAASFVLANANPLLKALLQRDNR